MARVDRNAINDRRQRRALAMLARKGTVHLSVGGDTPTGTVNGTNVTFTLAGVPIGGSEKVYVNGQRMTRGGSDDYTIAAAVITFAIAPKTGDKIRVDYDRSA